MKTIKISLILYAIIAIVFITGCDRQKTIEQKSHFVVGVNQYVQHPILDAVYKGLKERLDKEQNFEIKLKIANADMNMVNQINNQFVNNKVDLIVALGTPSAQSAVKISKDIPVVFGAITDPVAAKLADSLVKPGGNKTGTSDIWPFEKQVSLIKIVNPQTRIVGIITNPGEENCNAGMYYIRKELDKSGLKYIEVPVSNTSEILSAAKSLVGKIDMFLVSPSNVVVSGISSLIKVALDNKIPVIGGDRETVENGSLITYGFDNLEIGKETAELVIKILKENKNPGDIPVSKPPIVSLYLNETYLTKLSISIPKDLLLNAKEKFQ
jgi:putative tryptophan/tyrosine transport system substrate-binding protein